MKNGDSQNAISKALNRSQGTISKEIKRNRGDRGYRHKQANNFAYQRVVDKPKAIKLTDEIKLFVNEELTRHQSSPEQVAGRLKKLKGISLHYETIYRHILKDKEDNGELYLNLRCKAKPYRKRYGVSTNSTRGIPTRYFRWFK